MDSFDIEDIEELKEPAKKILNEHPKDVSVAEFLRHYKEIYERDLVPSHYGCSNAKDLIIRMSGKFKFMNITGDDSGSFRINLNQQELPFDSVFVDFDEELTDEETPSDAALNKVLSCQSLPINYKERTNFPAVVTQVIDPGKFFFNIFSEEHFTRAGEVMNEMDELYFSQEGNRYRIRSWRDLSPGCALAARYRDQGFHRASLIRVLPHGVVLLSYVDYSTVDRQRLASCRYLRRHWLELPGQAIMAHLYGVTPLSGTKYGAEARDEMLRLTSGTPGTLVAVIRSGVSKQEVVVHGTDQLDLYEWQGLAITLVDAIAGPHGQDVAVELHRQGLVGAAAMFELDVNEDVRHIQHTNRAGPDPSQSATKSFISEIVSDASDSCEPSDKLKLIRFLDLILCMLTHVVDDKLEIRSNDREVTKLVQEMTDKISQMRNEREELEFNEDTGAESKIKGFSKMSKMLHASFKEKQ